MLSLYLLTHETPSNKIFVLLQSAPIILATKISTHLRATWMHRKMRAVELPEDLLSQIGQLGNHNVTPQLSIGCQVRSHFFFFINFKLVHSYNVKHLTCIILCSSGLKNIYTSSIYGNVQHLQYLHLFTKFHLQNRPKRLPVGTYGCVAFDC